MTASRAIEPEARIRVLIIDDDPLLCSLLQQWIAREADLEVVATLTSGVEAITREDPIEADILLIDLQMPEVSGLAVMGSLLREGSPMRAVVLSAEEDEASLLAAFRAGARGYVIKRSGAAPVIEAIRAVAAGEVWVDRHQIGCLVGELARLSRRIEDLERPDAVLSDRERQVLHCIARGASNVQIAEELFLSPNTVKIHVTHMLRKLGLSNRTEAALFARQAGLVPAWELEIVRQAPIGSRSSQRVSRRSSTAP
jgi:DNA-binding NarL/FixJ family response regulator